MNKRTIFIITGKGGAGKDTVCQIAQKYNKGALITSVINTAKIIVVSLGLAKHIDCIDKTDEMRLLLSDLKASLDKYNNYSEKVVISEVLEYFNNDVNSLVFINARQEKDIEFLKKEFSKRIPECKVISLRILNPRTDDTVFGNFDDDNANNFPVDYTIVNDKDLDTLESKVIKMLEEI